MADGLEKVAGEGFGSSEAQIVHALDDLAHALCRTTDLCILGRSKKSSVFTPSFIWSDRVDGDPAHQWLRSFLFSEMRQHLGDLRAVPILRN